MVDYASWHGDLMSNSKSIWHSEISSIFLQRYILIHLKKKNEKIIEIFFTWFKALSAIVSNVKNKTHKKNVEIMAFRITNMALLNV